MSITSLLLGIWLFTGIVYRGEQQPRPNPNLQLQMMFLNEKQVKVHYSYLGESGFCESISDYDYNAEKSLLHTKVTWLNPENSSMCTQDPDMRMNAESYSEAKVDTDKFYLKLQLGDEDVVLIWDRQK